MNYNQGSRNSNALLASLSGGVQQVLTVVLSFVYRTVFLHILSKEYLGINGLFTNVLQLFSLAELGIGSAIVYSMYRPFAQKDTARISALLTFYKKIYHIVALCIVVMGFLFYPFLDFLVNVSEIPSDVNLGLVYALFVLQSAASYLFVYKQSALIADQRNHVVNLFSSLLLVVGFAFRLLALVITKKYVLVLAVDVFVTLVLNFLFSLWITRRYKEAFIKKEELSKKDKRKIFHDTAGLLCHKVGTVVVNGTDNIILSKFISLAVVGIYSNYQTVFLAVTGLASRLFSGMTASVADFVIKKSREESHSLLKKMLFANLWISSFTTLCLYLLINPFISLWLDDSYLLPTSAVVCICIQHYMQVARLTANNFLNACGLFMKDKIRPLIESALNLSISVFLAIKIGITGVFIGTVVSGALTYFWREPHLLYQNFFKKNEALYWKDQFVWAFLTVVLATAMRFVLELFGYGIFGFVIKCVLCLLIPNLIFLIVFRRAGEFQYFVSLLKSKLKI